MLNNNFILNGKTAKSLYERFAKDAPVYDYHCHLSAKEIYEDETFSDISSIWLGYDHYKWRTMRFAGVPEIYITGDGDGRNKFKMWAKTCERLIGSPLYHWANMELETYFGVNEVLKESNADKIYDCCNAKIKEDKLSPVKMIISSNVKLICTTDDPVDSLEYHLLLGKKTDKGFWVLPTFRPDNALKILNDNFVEYIKTLETSSNIKIITYKDLLAALKNRIEFFSRAGCVLSDHSLESLVYLPTDFDEAGSIFEKKLNGAPLSVEEAEKYKLYTLCVLAEAYKEAGWAMQLHIGAIRSTNDTMLKKAGVDSGFDIMNDFQIAEPLAKLLNDMDKKNSLPKTILYTLNSKDNLVLSSLPHCFTEDGVPGKVQFGAAWWFNDHREGITAHFKAIADQGMLAYFVGMLTDSRSFLSYVRHDYFRRILCSFVGDLVDKGEFADDDAILGEIVEGVCYKNVVRYLGL
ncbi:glucuronate isomerase [Ruminiclostridium papyrosolvens]|uniref:Uronate isomerase n=1 Tax=Ruminiclostridium papyrosolvens C7 TaxID=1330534 RepID=U4QYL6_9FIRM|nr:glucuronate isomerase [Ruminiclostridium papyrosolvens]EPR10012.1 glucuronate isomerase [Ruminiclostridium papyrosolvens C7]